MIITFNISTILIIRWTFEGCFYISVLGVDSFYTRICLTKIFISYPFRISLNSIAETYFFLLKINNEVIYIFKKEKLFLL